VTCTLLLIRHGATAWNHEGRYQGHCDPPLSAVGEAQVHRLDGALSSLRLDAVYSSDLGRAVATALPLAARHGLVVQTDPRLRELHFGTWDGRLVDDVIAADPSRWQAWWCDPVALAPPGGETVLQLWERVTKALGDICSRYPDGMVVAVTHGGPLRLVLARLATGRLHPPVQASMPNAAWILVTPRMIEFLLG